MYKEIVSVQLRFSELTIVLTRPISQSTVNMCKIITNIKIHFVSTFKTIECVEIKFGAALKIK